MNRSPSLSGASMGVRGHNDGSTVRRIRMQPPSGWKARTFLLIAVLLASMGGWACGQTARWVKIPMVRPQAGTGLVAEMVARLPDTSIMRGEDYVGRGHYAGHGLNSYIRNTYGRGTSVDCAAYVPGGLAFITPQFARFTLQEVINRTRTPLPGGPIPVRDWNHQPLYILDELSAYTCGTIAGIEAGHAQSTPTRGSFGCARACMDHARTIVILARERGYPHVAELAGFVERVEYIHGQIAKEMGER